MIILNKGKNKTEPAGTIITMADIFSTAEGKIPVYNVRALDKWIMKELFSIPTTRIFAGEIYPYKKYTVIEELLKVHAKDLILALVQKCPITDKKNTESIQESTAWIIWSKKIDPRSIMTGIPEYKSIWDKISEKEHV